MDEISGNQPTVLNCRTNEVPDTRSLLDGSTAVPVCLVVDDEPLLANFMASVAAEAGWIAKVADSAEKFEESLEHRHPDLIALDLAMPGRDGVELIRHLADVSYAGTIVIVSACDQSVLDASLSLAALHGLRALACVQKPVDAAEFVLLLDRARPNCSCEVA